LQGGSVFGGTADESMREEMLLAGSKDGGWV
jgi:hypothetical protein